MKSITIEQNQAIDTPIDVELIALHYGTFGIDLYCEMAKLQQFECTSTYIYPAIMRFLSVHPPGGARSADFTKVGGADNIVSY